MSTHASAFMPRTATASKSTATAPKAPRKTRTRKATTKPVVKTTIPTVTTTTFKSGKVVNKQTEIVKPSADLLPLSAYRQDIANRWNVHHYEMQELVKDFHKVVEYFTPYHAEMVKTVKAWTV